MPGSLGRVSTRMVERERGRVAHITINRAEKLNTLDPSTIALLTAAARPLRDDQELRAVVITQLVMEAADVFLAKYSGIMDGTFDEEIYAYLPSVAKLGPIRQREFPRCARLARARRNSLRPSRAPDDAESVWARHRSDRALLPVLGPVASRVCRSGLSNRC